LSSRPSCEELFAPRSIPTPLLLAAEPSGGAGEQRGWPTLLEVDDLKVWFPIKKGFLRNTVRLRQGGGRHHFSLPQGQTLGIVGESGSGKSTLGQAILRLMAARAGSVLRASN
jgi:microcin C transport system ATP-binding protein